MHSHTNYHVTALLLHCILSFAQQSMAKTAEAENMAIAHINVKEQKQLEALADRNLCLKVALCNCSTALHILLTVLLGRVGA
jgi:uncharacterized protein YaeQ